MHALIVYCVLCLIYLKPSSARVILDDYNKGRNSFLEEELALSLGGKLHLNDEERLANEILMKWKRKELDNSFQNPQYFNFSKHYFAYKKDIERSNVYQIIKRMPKGAALHIHSSLMLDADSMLDLTYEDHLYACYTDDDLQLHFSDTTPQRPCPVDWIILSDLRNASDNVADFDSRLKKYFTLYTEDTKSYDVNIDHVWNNFNKVHSTVKSLISYRPVREKFFYKALENFYNDNIMYIEIRTGLSSLYELNGTIHDRLYLARLHKRVARKFIEDHPDFIGIKLITTKRRTSDIDNVHKALILSRVLKNEMPDIFAGFDLVSQEDKGKPLLDFVPALTAVKDEINFFLHAGETAWYGISSDENLVDAVLLGSKRIGHGFALVKHPKILAAVKEKDIALEVNVISNVVLSLIRDVRNHPLATYLAQNIPVVLSSDDPGAWGADPLSHDFYVTFVGIASKRADIRLLKQLAINSIRYSALSDIDKTKAFIMFNEKWDKFIKDLIANNT